MSQKERRNSVRARRICFETHKKTDQQGRIWMTCHLNGCRIDPVRDPWRADHIRRWAEGGGDTPDNLLPICVRCDREEKVPKDISEVAKGKRVAAKHYGVKKRSARPMPGSKASRWKRKINGEVVPR